MTFPLSPILDSFTGADSLLSARSGWTADVNFLVIDGKVAHDPDENTYPDAYWSDAVFGPDCEVFATLTTRPEDNNFAALLARYDPVTQTGLFIFLKRRDSSTDLLCVGWQEGGFNVPVFVDIDLQDGDSFGLRIRHGVLTGYYKPVGGVKWLPVTVYTKLSYLAAGRVGIYLSDGTARIGDFGGGTIDGDAYASGVNLEEGTAGDGLPIPLHGDRSAWNVADYPGEHASDLRSMPVYHVPAPTDANQLIHSVDGHWDTYPQATLKTDLGSMPPTAHQLDGELHTVSGLTSGHFLKAIDENSFGFAALNLPILSSDPESPETGDAWILKTPITGEGMPMGLLLSLTLGSIIGYTRKFSVEDSDGVHRIDFDS